MASIRPLTKLSGKEYSPLILRRYSIPFLHWVGIISDDDLSPLDEIVVKFWQASPPQTSIQEMRNTCGELQKQILDAFPRIEGCAVIFAADKMLVSSLAGDFMNHLGCRLELYSLLNMSNLL